MVWHVDCIPVKTLLKRKERHALWSVEASVTTCPLYQSIDTGQVGAWSWGAVRRGSPGNSTESLSLQLRTLQERGSLSHRTAASQSTHGSVNVGPSPWHLSMFVCRCFTCIVRCTESARMSMCVMCRVWPQRKARLGSSSFAPPFDPPPDESSLQVC